MYSKEFHFDKIGSLDTHVFITHAMYRESSNTLQFCNFTELSVS